MGHQFNMFFHGKTLSLLEWLCMESFIQHGHSLNLHCYEDFVVPSGVKKIDAQKTLPFERFFIFHNSPSAFTNIFRYKLILETGDWWVDTDVLCLTDTVPECHYAWANQDPEQINGAILKFPKGDPLCKLLLELSIERAKTLDAWGQLGPGLLTEVLTDVRPPGLYGSQSQFYPTHWLEAHLCWMEGQASLVHSRLKDVPFLHLWNSILTKMGISLDYRPPAGSFFEELIADRQVPYETNSEKSCETIEKIKFFLDLDLSFKSFYNDTLGLDWGVIYPK